MAVNYLIKSDLPPGRTGKKTIRQVGSHLTTSLSALERQPSVLIANVVDRQPVCDICLGDGYYRLDVPVGHPEFGKAHICPCRETSIVAGLQELSGLAPSERLKALDDIDIGAGPGTAAMVSAAREFIDSPMGILTIHGSSGNAKTDVLQGVVNAFVAQRVEAVYMTIFDLMGWIREAFNNDRSVKSESAWERIKRVERVRILCVDEFDKVSQTDWVVDQITDLVDYRHRFGLDGVVSTIIAMNQDVEVLPPWITDRLRDGRNRIVRNDDPSLRSLMRR